jgi:hypothetical protein
MRSVGFGLLALALTVCALGCGSKGGTVRVEGVVKLDGQPLADATVTYNPVGAGQPASASTNEDGTFRLTTAGTDGAYPGEYKVTVTKSTAAASGKPNVDKEDMGDFMNKKMKGGMRGRGGPKGQRSAVPIIYTNPNKTPLIQKVPPEGKVTIELSSTGS